ncbi:hypothetical protein [Phenylobacterium sp.]|uniref:hypothetical protein n=1 Tax=Phenylobacterium sp. TaxID=1871053 RepID=UPI003BAD55B2
MTAVACLRVAVDVEKTGLSPAVLGPLVAKFSGIYLEGKWQWPRQFAPLTHYSFLLTDPRADELDVQELARLGDDLQIKLFGEGDDDAGKVGLLLFEGSAEAVKAFAALDDAAVSAALLDPSLLPPGGRLSRIEAAETEHDEAEPDLSPGGPVGPIWLTQQGAREDIAQETANQPMPQLEGVQGIYFTLRGVFVGDVISSTPGTLRTHLSLVEGDEHMPADPRAFDADCIAVAARMLAAPGPHSMLYLPVCYSNIVRASQRAVYEEMLATLPRDAKGKLAAAVYDVPRDPAFTSLATIRAMLSKYVTNIDLRTQDPGFEVEKVPPQAVTSVTMVLPHGDQRTRLAALRRFADRIHLYRKKQIWAAVTNVRNRLELDACIAARVPFVTGPGVCRLQTTPVGGRMQPPEALPLLAA